MEYRQKCADAFKSKLIEIGYEGLILDAILLGFRTGYNCGRLHDSQSVFQEAQINLIINAK
jgi:hypothetical protein